MLLKGTRLQHGPARPAGAFTLNRESAQARGLLHWWPLTPDLRGLDVVRNIYDPFTAGSSPEQWRARPTLGVCRDPIDSATIGLLTGLPLLSAPWTFAVWWQRIPQSSTFSVFTSNTGDGTSSIRSEIGAIIGFNDGGNQLTSPNVVGPTDHVALVVLVQPTSAGITVYIDGVNVASIPTFSAPLSRQCIGNYQNTSSFNAMGPFGEVRIWNRALTDADVWALYEPSTRWDLYQMPSARVYFNSGGGTTSVTLTATQAQAATIRKQANVIRLATQAETASVLRSVQVSRSATQGQTATALHQAQVVRTATQGQAAARSVIAQLIRAATQGQTATISRQAQPVRTATQGQAATILRSVLATRLATQATTATVQKAAQVIRIATQAQAATLAQLKVFLRALATTQATTATISRVAQVARTATQATAATMSRAVSVSRAASQAQSATIQRTVQAIRTATQGSTATIQALKVFLRALTATQAQVATILSRRTAPSNLTATQATTATISRQVQAVRTVQQATAATLQRALTRTLTAIQNTLASLLVTAHTVRQTKIYAIPASVDVTYAARASSTTTYLIGASY